MATAVGDLVVNLTANTGRFQKKMGGARSAIGGFVKSVGSGIARIGAFGAALAGAAGVGSISLLVKQSFKSIDATAKLATQIGATTEEISGLGFAAEQSGASQATLNSSLQRMTRRVGLFGEGTGAAKNALERLGFAAEDLEQLSAGEQFREIASRISEIPTAAGRGAAAFEIFGRSGQELLPLINQGPEGIRALTDEAEELGKTFSATDAAKIEEANDAMNRVKTAVTGAAQQLAIALAPAIETAANFVTEKILPAFQDFDDKIAAVGFAFANFGTSAQIALLDVVTTGLRALPQLEAPIEQVAATFIGTWSGVKAFFGSIVDNLIGSMMELKNVAEAVAAGISAAFASIKSGDIAGAAGAFGDAFIETFANQQDVEAPNALKEFSDAFKESRQATLDEFEKAGGLTGFLDDQRAALEKELADRADAFEAARNAEQKQREEDSAGFGGDDGDGQTGEAPPQFAKALEFGTAEAFNAISKSLGFGGESDAKKTAKASQQLVEQNEEQRAILDDIKNNTKPNKDKPIVV